MTSTFDALGTLCYIFYKEEIKPYQQLITRLFEYSVTEMDKRTPLKWKEWEAKNPTEFWGGKLKQVEAYFSDIHDIDHSQEYHFKTISGDLDLIIGHVKDWFYDYAGRKDFDRWYHIGQFEARVVKKYPKFFAELKRLIETKTINPDEYQMKGVKRWGKYV